MVKKFFFNTNLKFLRIRKKKSQQELADDLGIKRTQLASYEAGNSTPPADRLLLLADYFRITIDTLLTIDLSRIGEIQMRQLESGEDIYISGGSLRVLATTVNPDNRENIELVPVKAKAGYTAGYNDPEYIRTLPMFQLPFLSNDRKYRAFQIEGDSMLPIPGGAYVIGEFVQDWKSVKDGTACIILTETEGAVFKIVYHAANGVKKILLKSLNPLFKAYEINLMEVKEIWRFKYYFSDLLPEELTTNELILQKLIGIEEKLGG
jgi:transcriptional regulator with XRE-family HTH domain